MVRRKSTDESLLSIEKSLKTHLGPIDPDKGFIDELWQDLERSSLWDKQERTALSLLIIAVGLLVGTLIFLVGRYFLREQSET